jgi:nucleoside-diphosphate-sugar epimerase
MDVLVTGAAGLIASKTCEFLLKQNIKIVGIDNMNDYYDIKLKEYRLKSLKKSSNFEFHKIDIEDHIALDLLFSRNKIDIVLNLAARAGIRYSIKNPHIYFTTNTIGTLNILEMMKKYKTRKMVLASSSSLYAGQKMPFREDLPVNTPISPYAASKKAAEVLCYSYHYLYGIDVSIVRYFTVYGPAGRPDMSIFRFIKWIAEETPITLFGDGTEARDFTYVDDIANGTIKAMKEVGHEIINLGGGENPIPLSYVVQKIEEYLGKKAIIVHKPLNKAEMKETWADITKANKLLNWKPLIGFDEGLKRCVDWHNDNRELISSINCMSE